MIKVQGIRQPAGCGLKSVDRESIRITIEVPTALPSCLRTAGELSGFLDFGRWISPGRNSSNWPTTRWTIAVRSTPARSWPTESCSCGATGSCIALVSNTLNCGQRDSGWPTRLQKHRAPADGQSRQTTTEVLHRHRAFFCQELRQQP